MAYIDVTPTLIENTTMQIYTNSAGVQLVYRIYPNEGYILHNSPLDFLAEDGVTVLEGFTSYGCSVPISYDFETNPNNIYAILATEVPENQIFGTIGPETEVM